MAGDLNNIIITLLARECISREDVAVVRVPLLLLRLGPPEPNGFAELRPPFRVNVYTLDYVDGLCVDVRDPVEGLVVETTPQVESWVHWDLMSPARLRFCRLNSRSMRERPPETT